MLAIHIQGDPKEIAALVLELQERQFSASSADLADGVIQCFHNRRNGYNAVIAVMDEIHPKRAEAQTPTTTTP